MNKDCAIARDLMPQVIDGVASEESKAFVQEHTAGCEACAQAYADMQTEIHAVEGGKPPDAEPFFKAAMAQLRKTMGWKRLKTAVLAVVLTVVLVIGGCAAYYYLFSYADARYLSMDDYEVNLYQGSDGTVYGMTFFTKNYQAMHGSYLTCGEDNHILYVYWKSAVFPTEVELRVLPSPNGFRALMTADGALCLDDDTLVLEVRQGSPDNYVTVYQAGDAIPPLDPTVEEYFRLEDQLAEGAYKAQQMYADAEQALLDAQDEYYDAIDRLESGQTAVPTATPAE